MHNDIIKIICRLFYIMIVCLLVLFSAFLPGALIQPVFASDAMLSVQVSNGPYESGDTFTASIVLNDNPGFAGLFLKISYPEGIEAISVQPVGVDMMDLIDLMQGATWPDGWQYGSLLPAPIKDYFFVIWGRSSDYATSNTTLFEVTFRVTEDSIGGVNLINAAFEGRQGPRDPVNLAEDPLMIGITPGSVMIHATNLPVSIDVYNSVIIPPEESVPALPSEDVIDPDQEGNKFSLILVGDGARPTQKLIIASSRFTADELFYQSDGVWHRLISEKDPAGYFIIDLADSKYFIGRTTNTIEVNIKVQSVSAGTSRIVFSTDDNDPVAASAYAINGDASVLDSSFYPNGGIDKILVGSAGAYRHNAVFTSPYPNAITLSVIDSVGEGLANNLDYYRLQAYVITGDSIPVSNAEVSFSIVEGLGGSLSETTVSTDAGGYADVTITAGAPGSYTVRATVNEQPYIYDEITVLFESAFDLLFTMENKTGKAGQSLEVPITITNNPGIAMVRVDVELDDDLAWDYDPATYSSSPSTWPFIVGNVLPISGRPQQGVTLTDSFASILFMDDGGNSLTNGTLATLKLKIKETALPGDKEIKISITTCQNEADQNVPHNPVEPGKITVSNIVHGDANGDGAVDDRDLLRLVQYLNGWSVEIDPGADANGDGIVDDRDLLRLVQYLNGWPVSLG